MSSRELDPARRPGRRPGLRVLPAALATRRARAHAPHGADARARAPAGQRRGAAAPSRRRSLAVFGVRHVRRRLSRGGRALARPRAGDGRERRPLPGHRGLRARVPRRRDHGDALERRRAPRHPGAQRGPRGGRCAGALPRGRGDGACSDQDGDRSRHGGGGGGRAPVARDARGRRARPLHRGRGPRGPRVLARSQAPGAALRDARSGGSGRRHGGQVPAPQARAHPAGRPAARRSARELVVHQGRADRPLAPYRGRARAAAPRRYRGHRRRARRGRPLGRADRAGRLGRAARLPGARAARQPAQARRAGRGAPQGRVLAARRALVHGTSRAGRRRRRQRGGDGARARRAARERGDPLLPQGGALPRPRAQRRAPALDRGGGPPALPDAERGHGHRARERAPARRRAGRAARGARPERRRLRDDRRRGALRAARGGGSVVRPDAAGRRPSACSSRAPA